MKLQAGDQAGALAAYQESLDIARKLAAQDPSECAGAARRVGEPGQARRREAAGGRPGGGARRLPGEPRHRPQAGGARPRQCRAQRDVSVSLNHVGDVKRQAGDQAGAFAAYQESLAIERKLVAADPSDTQLQADLVITLNNLGLADTKHSRIWLSEALSIAERLDREHKLAADQAGWPKDLRRALATLPR